MFQRRVMVDAPVLSCLVILSFLAFYNSSFWAKTYPLVTWPYLIAVGLIAACIMFGAFTIATTKYTYKPFVIFAFFVAALSSYAMDNYGYIISPEAIKNILQTDAHESYDLMSWRLAGYIVVYFLAPSLLVLLIKVRYPSFKIVALNFILCAILAFGNILLFGRYFSTFFRNHKQIKYFVNPIRPIYSAIKYTVITLQPGVAREFLELDSNPSRVATAGKPKLVVLVVGESDRAKNQQLNGYQRATNPLLSTRSDVYSFNNFYACGTDTTISVPCMFSVYKREDYTDRKALYTENVLDLLQKSKVQVLWRDNDSGCKDVCNRVETQDFTEADIKPFCNGFECHDEVLLHNLQHHLDTNVQDKLIVLHKKGNHGPAYYKRYPDKFAQFTPTCNTNELHKCSDEEIINTYDNIILYTDFFLDRVINHLETRNDKYQTALIYVSDHGESLGEKGIYLHAMPYWVAPKEQIHVPFFFWSSPDFAVDRARLSAIQDKEFSHDHIFHTLLGLFGVQTVAYSQELDMFVS